MPGHKEEKKIKRKMKKLQFPSLPLAVERDDRVAGQGE
jgi:hypothetical protein